MKKITVTSLLLLLMVIALGLSRPSVQQSGSAYQSNEQLGIEITTNGCQEILYLPVGRTKEKGLIATIPVEGGGAVSAVRISPVMENGKVRFDVFLVSGTYSETISSDDLKRLPAVQVSTRVAAKGETLVVRDDISGNAPWSVNIKAVDLRKKPVTIGKNAQFLKISTTQEPVLEADGTDTSCGCAYCHDLRVCPRRGECLNTTCGSVCCPNG